jgi:neutral ceramidase
MCCAAGEILISEGTLENSNINRSPTSYEMNPQAERDLYDANTDKRMLQLTFLSEDKEAPPLGVLNWYHYTTSFYPRIYFA